MAAEIRLTLNTNSDSDGGLLVPSSWLPPFGMSSRLRVDHRKSAIVLVRRIKAGVCSATTLRHPNRWLPIHTDQFTPRNIPVSFLQRKAKEAISFRDKRIWGERLLQSSPDVARFEQLILPHLDSAYNFARWLTHDADEAQDLVQEACLRALEYFKGFRGESARAWLTAIVRNVCYDRRRQHQEQNAAEFDERVHTPEVNRFDPEVMLGRTRSSEVLAHALKQLPEEFREVLILRELEGLTYKEISVALDIPPGTVMSRLARARSRLQECLLERAQ